MDQSTSVFCAAEISITLLKAGVVHEGRILAGYYGFNVNISFTCQAFKNLSAHPTYLRFGLFVNYLVIFRYIFR